MQKRIWLFLVTLAAVAMMALSASAADKGLAQKDKKFATDAASGGMMEVQLGKMAGEKAQAQEVKDFGARMVTDHGKANEELTQLAKQKNLTLPTDLEQKHQATVDKLSKFSGADFDRQYMQEMVKDHTKDVDEFQKAAKGVQDPDLKAWAEKTLPVLQQHLKLAKDVAQKVGADVGKAGEHGQHGAEQKPAQKK